MGRKSSRAEANLLLCRATSTIDSAPILRIVGLATVPAPSKSAGKHHEWCDKPNRRFKQGWIDITSVYTLSLEQFTGDVDALSAFSTCYLYGKEPVGLCK